jgi:prenylcysteine oxidase/farnesylcysteine lyase
VDEIVAAAVRVNYGQNPSNAHALGGDISLATEGGSNSVVGGNRLIYENFAKASKADVQLNTRVKSLAKLDDNGGWLVTLDDGSRKTFDYVVLAAPFQQSGIEIYNSDAADAVPEQPYVHLHVTLLVTNATAPNGDLFGGKKGSKAPTTIYSTFEYADGGWNWGRRPRKPMFNSLSYLRRAGQDSFVVKSESSF